MQNETGDAEIRLMGLILAQSVFVGVGIGVFDAKLWLISDTPMLNGFTYAMAAFFVQGISYYFFKMFFEQNMQERVQATNVEKTRQSRYRQMQNPGKMPPSWGVPGGSPSMITSFDTTTGFNPGIPSHDAKVEQPINLGVNEKEDKEKAKKDN